MMNSIEVLVPGTRMHKYTATFLASARLHFPSVFIQSFLGREDLIAITTVILILGIDLQSNYSSNKIRTFKAMFSHNYEKVINLTNECFPGM